jgi:hypothetical protein
VNALKTVTVIVEASVVSVCAVTAVSVAAEHGGKFLAGNPIVALLQA